MAYTASFSVNVGDPTKANDVATLAANDDFLKTAIDKIMADSTTPTFALANGVTATTQSAGNNSTLLSTTAYADAAGVSLSGSTNNTIATVTGANALVGEPNLTFDGSTLNVVGNAGVGIARTDGTLHVHTATAGTVAAQANQDDLVVENSTHGGITILTPDASDATLAFGSASDSVGAILRWNHDANLFRIGTSNAGDSLAFEVATSSEAMRIDSSGKVGIGTAAPDMRLHAYDSIANYVTHFGQGNSSGSVQRFDFVGVDPDNNSAQFMAGYGNGVARMYCYSDGDFANHDGTYGTISDVKFKQDITDARGYWDDFKALQYRKFRHKTDVEADPDAPYRLGLIAQEVETVFPALVPESPDADITETINVIETVLDDGGEPVLDADGNETTRAVMIPVVDEEGEPILDADGNETLGAKTEEVTTPSGTTHKWVKSSIIEGPIMASVVQELMARVEALEAA